MTFFLIFLFGLVVGSFLNVLILRIPHGMSIRGRSKCVACQNALQWFELIPLLSYVVLRGKCRSCRIGISLQYPLVELATGILFFAAYYCNTLTPYQNEFGTGQAFQHFNIFVLLRYWFFIAVLIVLFVQDLRFQILPDIITIPAIGVAILTQMIPSFSLYALRFTLYAMVFGALFFLLQWLISRGRWVGGGDIRLGALMGAIVGWPNILLALFVAYITGALAGGILLLLGRVTRKSQMAFGTFLAASTVFTMFWGDAIVRWYSKIIGL